MLQWMGGSRRKVTASRKSTQKRQQQFFEQRKRQQQQQEATAAESHDDGPIAHVHQKGNRSLDILSLFNVPKVADEGKPVCGGESTPMMTNRAPSARTFEAVETKDHQSFMRSPLVVADEVAAPAEYVQPTGTGTLSRHQGEAVSSKSTLINVSTIRNAESKGWGIDSSIQTSFLDIIGDDGPTNSLENKPVHEAHVAFSVEGLGDLGTETPKQSPRQPTRISCGDKLSLNKAAKKLHFRKNLNSMLDDLEMEAECYMQDSNERSSGNHLDPFLTSTDVLSPLSYAEHELSPVNASKKYGVKRWERNSLLEDRDTNFWNAGSFFLDDDIVNEKYGLDWKDRDANMFRNVSPRFGFKEPQLLPRSRADITGRYMDLDEGDHHLCSLEEPKYTSFVSDYKRQATHLSPSMDMEDRRETSLRSEESCSSSAVRGRNITGMPSERHLQSYGEDLPWTLNSNAKENFHEEVQDIMTSAARPGEECDRSRKYRRSNAGHTKSAHISLPTVNKKFHLEDSWLPEEEFPNFPLGNTDTDSCSFIPGSWKNRHHVRGRDPFRTNIQTDLPNCSSSRFDMFENKTPGGFSPENISSFQQFSRGGSYRERSNGVYHDLNIPVQSSNSAHVADFFGDTEAVFPVPELSAQGSVTEVVGDKIESNPKNMNQVSPQNLNISQDSKSTKENESAFGKEKYGIQEIIANSSEEDTEETSPPVMIDHELDGELNTKEMKRSIPGLCQQNLKVSTTKPVSDENLKGSQGKTTLIQSSCQVTTVERYVFQLFYVSQGKSAMWDATKRLS